MACPRVLESFRLFIPPPNPIFFYFNSSLGKIRKQHVTSTEQFLLRPFLGILRDAVLFKMNHIAALSAKIRRFARYSGVLRLANVGIFKSRDQQANTLSHLCSCGIYHDV